MQLQLLLLDPKPSWSRGVVSRISSLENDKYECTLGNKQFDYRFRTYKLENMIDAIFFSP